MSKSKSQFKDEYTYQVEQACKDGDYGAKEVAKLFNVTKNTVYTWRKAHPEFQEAMDRGRDEFDLSTAETSLKKRLLGYFYNEITSTPPLAKYNFTAEEKNSTELRVTKVVKRHVPPDTHALSFFLRNRNRERWPDRQDVDLNFTKKLSDAEIDRSIALIINNTTKKKKRKHAAGG